MLLKKLQVKWFGCLDDFSAVFEPGLNVIRGPNESGKSTLHQALLMALMTPPTKTKTNSVWRAWGTDHYYWLRLTLADREGGSYQITKDFEAGFQEIALPTGETTRNRDAIQNVLITVLGTNSSLMFRSTLCVQQDALAAIEDGSREIAQSLEAVVTGSDDDTYTEQTLKKLDRVMRDFRKGYTRIAAKPGPLAKARDDRARLVEQVTEYKIQVQSQGKNQRLLDKAETRLVEIEQKLGPAIATKEQAHRVQSLRSDLEVFEEEEEELEKRLSQAKFSQEEITSTETDLRALGPVSQLTEADVTEAVKLNSRGLTLRDEYTRYQKSLGQYKEVLAGHQEEEFKYEQAAAAYDRAVASYEGEQAQFREDLKAYNTAVAQYDSDLVAYQAAFVPYETAFKARKDESEYFEVQRIQYEQDLAVYKAESAQYTSSRNEQEQQLAEHDRSYEEFERQRDAYDQVQAEYRLAADQYEASLTAKTSGTVSGNLILITIGGIVVIFGIVLLLMIANALPGMATLALGALLIGVGILRKSPADRGAVSSGLEPPVPPTIERPAAPQRPKFVQLTQLQPPTPPKALESASEAVEKPDIERPRPPTIEQPAPPTQKQPIPPTPPQPAPEEPSFDKTALQSTADQLKDILQAAGCSSVGELKERYAQVASLREMQAASRSRLEGLLSDSTLEELEVERLAVSRKRRDVQEILDQPDLQRADAITPLEYNKLADEIESFEREQDELQKERQRLQISIDIQPVSTEDLMQAEEALEAASSALTQAQDRIAVYELTREVLDEARTLTLKKAQERLVPQTVTYLGHLTRGRYKQAWIDSDLNIELEDPTHSGRRIPTNRLSRGAQDQLYMAARLALVDLLFPDTNPPILLDDPFVHFDPQRLAAAIEMCSDLAKDRQILLFTCSEDYNQVGHHILMPPLQQSA